MRSTFGLILVLSHFIVCSQGGFRARFNLPGAAGHLSYGMYETSPGNYLGFGVSYESVNNRVTNFLTVSEIDQSGNKIWTKKYGSSQFQYIHNPFVRRRLFKINNDIYYVGCVRKPFKDVGVLIKFAPNGDTLWQKVFESPNYIPALQGVSGSVDGGLLIVGYIIDQVIGEPGLIIKTDKNGNELWRKLVNKPAPNIMSCRAVTQDPVTKKIAVVGYQGGFGAFQTQYHDNLLILDSLGVKLSQHQLLPNQGTLFDLIRTGDGKFVSCGVNQTNTLSGAETKNYSYIFKFDINNPSQPIWSVSDFGPLSTGNEFSSLYELPGGNLFVGGFVDTIFEYTHTSYNVFAQFVTFSSTGALLKNKICSYGPQNTADPYYIIGINSVEPASGGGWLAAIEEVNNKRGISSFFFAKYDSTGCDSTEVYCRNPTGIHSVNHEKNVLKIYPNPVSDHLFISGDRELMEKTFLVVTDVCGKLVIQQEKCSNEIDVRALSSGVYFLSLKEGERTLVCEKFVKTD